jgi:hypothetical protein
LIEAVGDEAVVAVENDGVGVGGGTEEEIADGEGGEGATDGEGGEGGAAAKVEANIDLERVAVEADESEVVDVEEIGIADDVGRVLRG